MGTLLTDIPELSGSIQSSATPSVSSPAAQSSGKASTGSFADAMEQANGSGSTSAESVDSKSSAATANEAEDNNVTNASLQYGRNSAREEDWRTMASLTPEQRKNATESVPVTKPVQREDQSRRSASLDVAPTDTSGKRKSETAPQASAAADAYGDFSSAQTTIAAQNVAPLAGMERNSSQKVEGSAGSAAKPLPVAAQTGVELPGGLWTTSASVVAFPEVQGGLVQSCSGEGVSDPAATDVAPAMRMMASGVAAIAARGAATIQDASAMKEALSGSSEKSDAGNGVEAATPNADPGATVAEAMGSTTPLLKNLPGMEGSELNLHRVARVVGAATARSVQELPCGSKATTASTGTMSVAGAVQSESGLRTTTESANAKGSANAGELFAALEGGSENTASSPLRGLRLSASELGVGFVDPQHGWVEVRAGASGGSVHASVIAETATAGQQLSIGLDSVARQMSAEGQGIQSLTVAVDTGGSGSAGGQKSADRPVSDGSDGFEVQRQTPATVSGAGWSDTDATPSASWGGRVSVLV